MLVAHAGHWAIWVLYAVPVIAVLIAVFTASVKARRLEDEKAREAAGETGETTRPPAGD